MISHERAQRLLSARLDELLPPADHRALQDHLATCPECRLFARQAETLMQDLRGLPFLPPSPAVSRTVMAEIRGGAGGFSPLAWLGGLRFSPGPAVAVVSSFVLIAALAYTVSFALKPPGQRPDPAATAAAVALAPKTTPPPQPIVAPTEAPLPPVQQLVPTAAAAVAPTRPAEAAPTATRPISIQAPPTPTPTFVVATEAPPVEQPAVVVATEAPVEPAPTEAPQLAQGDTTQSMDLAQNAHKTGKGSQRAEAQAADA
ncbi:MAG TPA: zf-HC2 domain-containing protein, partial [Thermomicrobiales bacterium]|nr:zf-HC2 domain-containing protein [Thermomicrobiales bacterium]